LLGEAQLNNMLHSALPDELLDRLCEFSLKQFGSEDTLAYVRFKLACAGYDKDLPLSSGELGNIRSITDGIPGAINTEVARALTAVPATTVAAEANKSWLIPGWRYWIATAALLLLLLGAILSTDSQPGASVEIATGVVAEKGMEAAVEPASVASSSDSQAGGARQQIAIPTAFVAEPVAMPVTASNALGAVSPETLHEQAAQAASEVVAGVAPMPAPVKAEAATKVVAGSVASESSTDAVPLMPVVRLSGFEQQLLALAPGSYTVQVMASSAESKVKEFVADTMVPQPKGYFETRYRGQPWFVVVAGNYGNRTAATDSIQQLPESLRSLQPWVRNLADIQDAIRVLGPAP
jgi:DamX protein